MLIACQENGNLLNAVEDTVNPLDKFLCPACLEAVCFKKGRIMRPHFAHISLKDCHFYTENESAEHLNLKAALFTWARKSNHAVQVEAYLPKLQQIADLLVEKQIALEVQCSSLISGVRHQAWLIFVFLVQTVIINMVIMFFGY